VRENGLVGTLYRPATPGPHPAVMILNGSGGGMNEPRAALYASHGYLALALAYFKAPGLSNYISNTPLEYFKRGLDWMRATLKPAGGFVALNGQSRGGELVLLLASLYPKDVSAVVAYVPGAVVHGGQNAADPAVGRDGPAWLLDGKPVVHIWNDNRTASWAAYDAGQRHEVSIRTALQDADAVARARIRVERIRAPIILLSGTDDGAWPSSLYSRMVVDTLRENQHPYDYQWVDTPDAGHAIVFPYIPTTQITHKHAVTGRMFTGGGAPGPNAISNENSWNSIKAFLARAVSSHAPE
jgi:dienelactone hydrolase